MKKIFALISALSLTISAAWAVLADPTPFEYTMPDGSVVMAVLHGDEYHSYITDLQGNLISGTLPSTQQQNMHRIHRQQQLHGSSYPRMGHPKTLAILLDFQDVKFQHDSKDFDRLLNQQGYSENGATGSVYDYFMACSNNQFAPDVDVFGPYTVRGKMADYGARNGQRNDTDPAAAFIEACQLAEDDGVDFTKYDVDGDGVIDNVFFYYAGNNEAEGGGADCIWPHQSDISYRDVRIGGRLLSSYACTSECRGRGNVMCAIGTFCHEFGHVLGLPDTYDTGETSINAYTVGAWDIMCSGNYNNNGCTPPIYNAWEQFFLGWLKPVQLSEPGTYILRPLETDYQCYLIAADKHNMVADAPSPSEYFLLEYRSPKGWDAPSGALYAEGMLVWHIDYSAPVFYSNQVNNSNPLRLHLDEAGGNKGTESISDPYPGSRKVTTYTPVLHNGTPLVDQILYNIAMENDVITFIYKEDGTSSITLTPSELHLTLEMDANDKPIAWKSVPVSLHAEGLQPDTKVVLSAPKKNNFYITQNESAVVSRTSKYWLRTLTLSNVADSTGVVDATFYISYNPSAMDCAGEATVLSVSAGNANTTLALQASAPRAIMVETPKILPESDLTPYSVTLNWKPQTDAEEFYVTLYQVEHGTTEYTQDFENFNSQDKIIAQGWQSTTTTTTTAAKKDGQRALVFKKTGDSFTTETYQSTISQVSFWLNTMTSDVDVVGHLSMEASINGYDFQSVYEEDIKSLTLNKTVTVDLDPKLGYCCFRLSYTDKGGNGIAIDAFTAIANQKITYVYRGRDMAVPGSQNSCTLSGLMPSSTYFYQVQSTDLDKGCEEHLTLPSTPREVVTPKGVDPDSNQLMIERDTISYNEPTGSILLPALEDDYGLFVFDQSGHLVWSTTVAKGQTHVVLPPSQFVRGRYYIAKYTALKKINRKDRWVKFIF